MHGSGCGGNLFCGPFDIEDPYDGPRYLVEVTWRNVCDTAIAIEWTYVVTRRTSLGVATDTYIALAGKDPVEPGDQFVLPFGYPHDSEYKPWQDRLLIESHALVFTIDAMDFSQTVELHRGGWVEDGPYPRVHLQPSVVSCPESGVVNSASINS